MCSTKYSMPETSLIFFLILFLKLYIIVLVLPNIKMNPPQVYMCSPPWTLLPPPSPYHPSGSSQCTSPNHPVSRIEPGLVTHSIYDIIRISMPFSQIIPPLSHRVQTLFLMSQTATTIRNKMGTNFRENFSGILEALLLKRYFSEVN